MNDDEPTTALARPITTALRQRAREALPFELRVGVRRLPHVLRWLTHRPARRDEPPLPHPVCERRSPLQRPGTTYDPRAQQAKEHNVARVVRAIDGSTLAPQQRWSWHARVGPPLRVRGFADGPELHDGALARGPGGGACQVANLVFWLAAVGGLTIVERHRHGLDLFPDSGRDVPFGCGATVYYPHRDLVLHNPHPVPVQLRLAIRDGHVHGALVAAASLPGVWSLHERDARLFRSGGVVWRSNRIVRRHEHEGTVTEHTLVRNLARVLYPVAPEDLESRC